MTTAWRNGVRDVFHRLLFSRALSPARPLGVRLLQRIHNHVFNCNTSPRANGEDWLVRRLPRSGLFLDIGFNRGDWSREVLARCLEARVHAFDPCRDVVEIVKGLNLPNERFAFHPVALSNAQGTSRFYDYGDLNGRNSLVDRIRDVVTDIEAVTYPVSVTTLDAWTVEEQVSFIDVIKLDAEGSDLPILEGAAGLLADQRVDLIVFEYDSGWFASKRTLFEADQFLTERGYAVYRLFPYFLVPYRYQVGHEGMLVGYFVALSEKVDATERYSTRDLVL